MSSSKRLIETSFCLKQASMDSIHEKMCHAGHIKALHIWPARRPLAACRAALIATLLPDPGTPEKRMELLDKVGGRVVKKIERKKMPDGQTVEREKEITEGGILHWGRETENKEVVDWFREEINKAYGGRAPKVMDPFAGGGAIPLEAMRLGCEAVAIDINPVAWFILKCTLEYPQKLAGKTHPLPDYILENEEFMHTFYKAHPHLVGRTKPTKKQLKEQETKLWQSHREDNERIPKADLAWHVRAWGYWVLDKARRELAIYYPTYAEFEPLDKLNPKPYEKQPMQLVPLKDDATPDIASLNKDFSKDYLEDKKNPRWITKPTVAYLWARTVPCKNCRITVPLLKSQWLCKKENKRVRLMMEPNHNRTGVVFAIETNVPVKGGNAAQRREHDKRIGVGTMFRSGAKCPCCGTILEMEYIRLEGQAGRIGSILIAVVVSDSKGKSFRQPTLAELEAVQRAEASLPLLYSQIQFGLPNEPLSSKEALGFRVPLYGFNTWASLFSHRQLFVLGSLSKLIHDVKGKLSHYYYNEDWATSIVAYLACILNKVADYNSAFVAWQPKSVKGSNTFQRWALPMKWDFTENNILDSDSGGWLAMTNWVATPLEGALNTAVRGALSPKIYRASAMTVVDDVDLIVTDPPYYDAIPYSDLMDFFYVWLRRTVYGLSPEYDRMFSQVLSPKWDSESNDGELIDDSSRHGGDKLKSKAVYEEGMFRVFSSCFNALRTDGRLVIVFAHKQPDAWETLVSAIVKAGFTVDSSWPIQTEMGNRTRSQSSAALASSVWLVCKKRPIMARPGWDTQVLEEMRHNIKERLREYWDAGIKGPDFVWAATGPALEAYSEHPVVKKANDPGQILQVHEFLNHVRRMVVDFVVGRVLSGGKEGEAELAAADRLDDLTAYYLLHRNDFGLDEAPAGACILYAISCGISDKELAATWDMISFTKGKSSDEYEEEAESDADEEAASEVEEESGSKVKLKTWAQRKGRSMGYDAPGGKPVPLIDRIHRLMHLWKEGDLHKVDQYLDDNGLRRHELFRRLLQSLIELSLHNSEERSLLESLSNHVQAKGAAPQMSLGLPSEE